VVIDGQFGRHYNDQFGSSYDEDGMTDVFEDIEGCTRFDVG